MVCAVSVAGGSSLCSPACLRSCGHQCVLRGRTGGCAGLRTAVRGAGSCAPSCTLRSLVPCSGDRDGAGTCLRETQGQGQVGWQPVALGAERVIWGTSPVKTFLVACSLSALTGVQKQWVLAGVPSSGWQHRQLGWCLCLLCRSLESVAALG